MGGQRIPSTFLINTDKLRENSMQFLTSSASARVHEEHHVPANKAYLSMIYANTPTGTESVQSIKTLVSLAVDLSCIFNKF